MKVGILGVGKMGTDIFQYLMNEPDNMESVLICRSPQRAEQESGKLLRKIEKKVRRGILSSEEAGQLQARFQITADNRLLEDCDLVIETVLEDLTVKQTVLKEAEGVVGETCFLVTNTSALPFDLVFQKVKNKKRCAGMHFFYPVSVLKTVELGMLKETEPKTRKALEAFLTDISKFPLCTEGETNLILSRILAAIVAYAWHLYQNTFLRLQEIDRVIKNSVMMFGAFEIMDRTGFLIISQCLRYLTDSRNKEICEALLTQIQILQKEGLDGGADNGFFSAAERGILIRPSVDRLVSVTEKEAGEKMKQFIQNEIRYYTEHTSLRKDRLILAMSEAMGIRKEVMEEA